MDELLKALAEAIRNGTALAAPAVHAYFVFRIVDDVISYLVPCASVVTVAGMITYTIRWGINRACVSDEKQAEIRKGGPRA